MDKRLPLYVKKQLLFKDTWITAIQEKYKSGSYKEKQSLRQTLTSKLFRKYRLVSEPKKHTGISHNAYNNYKVKQKACRRVL